MPRKNEAAIERCVSGAVGDVSGTVRPTADDEEGCK